MGHLGSVVGQSKRYFWVAGVGGRGELFLTPQKSDHINNHTRPASEENKQKLTKYICVYVHSRHMYFIYKMAQNS